MRWKDSEYLAYLEGQVHVISQLLDAGAISIGVLEVDGHRLGNKYFNIFEDWMAGYLTDPSIDYYYHMDLVHSKDSYFMIAIATTPGKIEDARRVFQLTDPHLYRNKIDHLLGGGCIIQ